MNELDASAELELRRKVMENLYDAYRQDGLYRGVVGRKNLAAELQCENIALERNLEYLLDRGLIRMHKIEDLISISTQGIDYLEHGRVEDPASRIADSLERIEKLLAEVHNRLAERN